MQGEGEITMLISFSDFIKGYETEESAKKWLEEQRAKEDKQEE